MFTLVASPHRFGTVVFDVEMVDDGGMKHGGVERASLGQITIDVQPINTPPHFELSTDTDNTITWQQGAGRAVIPHAVRAIELGRFESQSITDCPLGDCKKHPRLAKPSLTCSGSCACSPSSNQTSGTISSGSYLPNSQCEWLISAASDIVLHFTWFDVYYEHDFVTINRCFDATCQHVDNVAILSGNTVSSSTEFRSWTGFLQLVFTSSPNFWSKRSGFTAEWLVVDSDLIYAATQDTAMGESRCDFFDYLIASDNSSVPGRCGHHCTRRRECRALVRRGRARDVSHRPQGRSPA